MSAGPEKGTRPVESTAPGGAASVVPADAEVVGLRTESSKTFGDGKGMLEARIYSQPVHFRDGTGRWAEIDDRVEFDETAKAFVNGPNRVRVSLPATAGGPTRISDGNRWVSFVLEGARGRGVEVGETVRYTQALPGVDVSVQPTAAGVKELPHCSAPAAPDTTIKSTTNTAIRTRHGRLIGPTGYADTGPPG